MRRYFVPIVWLPLLSWMALAATGHTHFPLGAASEPVSIATFVLSYAFGCLYWTWLE